MNTVSKFLFAIMLTIGCVNLNAGDTRITFPASNSSSPSISLTIRQADIEEGKTWTTLLKEQCGSYNVTAEIDDEKFDLDKPITQEHVNMLTSPETIAIAQVTPAENIGGGASAAADDMQEQSLTEDQNAERIAELQARINAKQTEYENQYQLTLNALKEEILSPEKSAKVNAVQALTALRELFLESNRLNQEISQVRMGSAVAPIDKTTEIHALQRRLKDHNHIRLASFVNNDNTMTDGQKLQFVQIYDGITTEAQAQALAQAQAAQRTKIQSYLLRGAKATAAVIVGVAFVKSGLAQKSFNWIASALTSLNKMIQFKKNIVIVNVPAART